jgi:large subunit ribosomal protein L15
LCSWNYQKNRLFVIGKGSIIMQLNTLCPALGSKRRSKRLGRGTGSGKGKTCGRGHKGQRARAGGYHKVGFEGGQMPFQRRVPKFGFRSRQALLREEVYLSHLDRLKETTIDLAVLILAGIVRANTKDVKIIASGKLTRPVTIQGIPVSAGARQAIEAANGKVE